MPIDYKDYHPKWSLIRRLILKRANNCCEECGIENYAIGYRGKNGNFIEIDKVKDEFLYEKYNNEKGIKIVLTIAHLDHNKNNNRFWNLKALCQRCHLRIDIHQHIANRKYGRNWKRNQIKMDI